MKPIPFDETLRARLAANLARLRPAPLDAGGLKRAAVCVIVTGEAGEATFVLTKRAARLSTHAGQYALPGGRMDQGETALDAARREAREEIGLELAPEDFIGRLDDYPTRSGFVITPVVVWGGGVTTLRPNPAEVASVHHVPLRDLEHPDVPRLIAIPESERPVIQLPILSTLVHAPTAAVVYQLREVVVHGRATRVDHFEQPVWAWR